MKLTKTEEKILERMRAACANGALTGRLATGIRENAAFDKLISKGLIEYVEWTPADGAGWRISQPKV